MLDKNKLSNIKNDDQNILKQLLSPFTSDEYNNKMKAWYYEDQSKLNEIDKLIANNAINLEKRRELSGDYFSEMQKNEINKNIEDRRKHINLPFDIINKALTQDSYNPEIKKLLELEYEKEKTKYINQKNNELCDILSRINQNLDNTELFKEITRRHFDHYQNIHPYSIDYLPKLIELLTKTGLDDKIELLKDLMPDLDLSSDSHEAALEADRQAKKCSYNIFKQH